jgi:hypothetical protein
MHWGTDITAKGQRVGNPPLQAPWIIVIASAAERKRLCQTPHRQTESCLWRRQDFSVSDQGGHDNRRPKRRITENDVGASKWMLEEWRMLLTSGDASDSKESSEDDGKPQIHMNPSKSKAQWSAADTQR